MANRPDMRERNRKAAEVRKGIAWARLQQGMSGALKARGTVAVPTLAEIRARVDAAVARMKAAE